MCRKAIVQFMLRGKVLDCEVKCHQVNTCQMFSLYTCCYGHLPVSRRSWRCRHLCCCPGVGWCARTERSSLAHWWPDCPEGGCKKYTALNNKKIHITYSIYVSMAEEIWFLKCFLKMKPTFYSRCSSSSLTWGCSVGQQGNLGCSRSGWCQCAAEARSSGRAVSVTGASGCILGNQTTSWQQH